MDIIACWGTLGVLFVTLFVQSTIGLMCWECKMAGSDDHCFRIGKWMRCKTDQLCYIEQRYENGFQRHIRGCKQKYACDVLTEQNEFQCNGEVFKDILALNNPGTPMTCRHCCKSSYCNPTDTAREAIQKMRRLLPSPTPPPFGKFFPRKRPIKVPKAVTTKSPPLWPKRKPGSLGRVYYPGIGWIELSVPDNKLLPPPPPSLISENRALFSTSSNISDDLVNYIHPPLQALHNRTREKMLKKKESCTSLRNPLTRKPEDLIPKEECIFETPQSCVNDGTVVLTLEKLKTNEGFGNDKDENMCLRTPTLETVMVYDEGDHYVLIAKINYRTAARLPSRKKGKFFVGDIRISDINSRKDMRRFRNGNESFYSYSLGLDTHEQMKETEFFDFDSTDTQGAVFGLSIRI